MDERRSGLMLCFSEYSSGLHRSAQGPNPDEIVTKVPKIHPMVEMLTAPSQGDVVFGVTNASDERVTFGANPFDSGGNLGTQRSNSVRTVESAAAGGLGWVKPR
jgi:hypothetical protein